MTLAVQNGSTHEKECPSAPEIAGLARYRTHPTAVRGQLLTVRATTRLETSRVYK